MASSVLRNPNSKRLLSFLSPLHSFKRERILICANAKVSEVRSRSFRPIFTSNCTPFSSLRSFFTLSTDSGLVNEVEKKKKKKETTRKLNLKEVHKFINYAKDLGIRIEFRIGTVYYGASEVNHLNEEDIALKDAVCRAIAEKFTDGQKLVQLGKEPTSEWILHHRVQSDRRDWDLVVSVNIDKVTDEELSKISGRGIKNVFWLVIAKERAENDVDVIMLSKAKFLGFIIPLSNFFKNSSDCV